MSRPQSKSTSRWISTSLLLLSSLGALVACELGLRLFHPKYEDVSRYGKYQADESRLWAPIPNTSRYKTHPDTGARHPVIYNNFGSRQHRRFDVDALKQAENIAFFGDSFAENSGIEAQYSFTEVLDFLLNLQDDRDFNVLNFGVDGYGLGQEFVWYQQFPHRDDLDHVVYVFCDNDIENFHNHRLFSLDESGDLVANVAVGRGTFVAALSRLQLTYLVLDFMQRLSLPRSTVAPLPKKGPPVEQIGPIHLINERIVRRKQDSAPSGDALDDSIAAFQALLSHWQEVVEARGGDFRVVVPPYLNRESVGGFFPTHVDVVYLLECFEDMIPRFNYLDWSFRSTDMHWNEAGNMVAAHCLYRLLEEEAGVPTLPEAALANARYEYYSAVGTGNWDPPPAWVAPSAQPALDGAEIAAKYMQLDHRQGVLELLDGNTPAGRGDWAVYRLSGESSDRALLAYAKTPCRKEDQEDPFFLHVTPRDPRRLSKERAVHGFDNLDFNFTDAWLTTSLPASANDVSREGWTLNDQCVFGTELPDYEIARIRTGQYTDAGTIWEVEIALDGAR